MTVSTPIPGSRDPAKGLLLAIHDVGPASARQVEQLRALLGRFVPEDHIAMLVVPDFWGRAPLLPGSSFARKLRAWSDAGTEMFVHGWFHRDDSVHLAAAARFKARHLTASEGEFLGLSHDAALERMRTGRALIEEVIGRPPAGFVAPAWLYGPGARAALAPAGFALAEDHLRVWRPADGRVLCRGPVITWASRSRARIASSLAGAFLLRRLLAPAAIVRVAVHPGDVGEPVLLASIERTVARLAARRAPIRYADLAAAKAAPEVSFGRLAA